MIDLTGKSGRRHRRLARHRPGDRACGWRRQGADVAFSYRGNAAAAAATVAEVEAPGPPGRSPSRPT